jgi:AraC family transcriptional regulator
MEQTERAARLPYLSLFRSTAILRDVKRCSDPVSFGSPRFVTVETGAFLVTNAWFPPAAFLPRHYHDRTVVGVTLMGRGNSILGSREVGMDPGTLHTEPAGDSHSNRFSAAGARIVVVQPDPRAEELLGKCRPLLTQIHRITQPQPVALARRMCAEIARPDTLSSLAIESACLELLTIGTRALSSGTSAEHGLASWLPRVIEYLHAHFLECPTIARLSSIAGVHPAHFTRAFRHVLRQSPATYVRRLRLDWAAEAMDRTDHSLVEIAAASGFADQSHFTRAFRRHMGATPAAYRRRSPDSAFEASSRSRRPASAEATAVRRSVGQGGSDAADE